MEGTAMSTDLPDDIARLVDEALDAFDFATVALLFQTLGHLYAGHGPIEMMTIYENDPLFGRVPYHVPDESELRETARELLEQAALNPDEMAIVDSGRLAALKVGRRLRLWYVPVASESGA